MTIRRRKKVPYTKLSSVPSDEDVIQLYEKREVIFKSKVWGFDLPEKDFIKGMAYLTSQSYGPRIQNYIREILVWKKVKAAEMRGDIAKPLLVAPNLRFVEVKTSILSATNNFLNMVQIRLFHDIDYYLCCAYDLRDPLNYESFMFLLTHDQMVEECEDANAAHGTKSVNELNKNVELRLSVTCDEGDPDFERWKKMYRVDSYEGIEKGVL